MWMSKRPAYCCLLGWGKGMRDTMVLGKGVVVFEVILTVSSRLFLGLFTEKSGFGEI